MAGSWAQDIVTVKAKKRTVVERGSQEKEDSEWYLLEYLHQQVPVSHASRGELKGGGAEFHLFLPQVFLLLL